VETFDQAKDRAELLPASFNVEIDEMPRECGCHKVFHTRVPVVLFAFTPFDGVRKGWTGWKQQLADRDFARYARSP
jgi:hypothetical protein